MKLKSMKISILEAKKAMNGDYFAEMSASRLRHLIDLDVSSVVTKNMPTVQIPMQELNDECKKLGDIDTYYLFFAMKWGVYRFSGVLNERKINAINRQPCVDDITIDFGQLPEPTGTEYVLSANRNDYHHADALTTHGYIDWQQKSYKFEPGDIVYLYFTDLPEGKASRIMCKTMVVKTDIPFEEIANDSMYWLKYKKYLERIDGVYIRLKLVSKILDDERLTKENIAKKNEYRNVPQSRWNVKPALSEYLARFFGESCDGSEVKEPPVNEQVPMNTQQKTGGEEPPTQREIQKREVKKNDMESRLIETPETPSEESSFDFDFRSLQGGYRMGDDGWVPVDSLSNCEFVIKPYQRGYRWDKKNIQHLLEDLLRYCENLKDVDRWFKGVLNGSTDSDYKMEYDFYCLQTLTVKKIGEDNSNRYELIDGQQRLTTVLLLYSMLNYILNEGDSTPYKLIYERTSEESIDVFSQYLESLLSGENPKPHYKAKDKEWFKNKSNVITTKLLDNCKSVDGMLKIDLQYIALAIEEIFRFLLDIDHPQNNSDTLEQLYRVLKWNVMFLWYETPNDAYETFSSLNTNLIRLTNAELIKSLVLRSDAKPEGGGTVACAKWEAIEQGLNRPDLWAFINGETKDTRIDFILELIRRDGPSSLESDGVRFSDDMLRRLESVTGDYALFEWYDLIYQEYKKKESSFSRVVIKACQDKFDRIDEWYDDVDIYHYTGLLTKYRELTGVKINGSEIKRQEEMVYELFLQYNICITKSEFVDYLKTVIINSIKQGRDQDLKTIITDVSYDANNKSKDGDKVIQAILWLVNVHETVEAADNNIGQGRRRGTVVRRMPFSRIVNNTWSLEHIMPQNPNKKDSKEWGVYNELLESIKKDKDEGKQFEIVKDIHSIKNLALLRTPENSKLQNQSFESKRNRLITLISQGAYVPSSTISAFLLYYNSLAEEKRKEEEKNAKKDTGDGNGSIERNHNSETYDIDRKYWTESNAEKYLEYLIETVKKYNAKVQVSGGNV